MSYERCYTKTCSHRYHTPGSQQKSTWRRCSERCRCEYYRRRPAPCRSAALQSGGTGPSRSLRGSTCTHRRGQECRNREERKTVSALRDIQTVLSTHLSVLLGETAGSCQGVWHKPNCSTEDSAHANVNTNKDIVGGRGQLCVTSWPHCGDQLWKFQQQIHKHATGSFIFECLWIF